jgi:hypothetical protein
MVIVTGPPYRRHGDLGAQHGLGQGDRELDVDVPAVLALEHGVGLEAHLDVGVAARAAAQSRPAHAGEPKEVAVLDPRRDRRLDLAAVGQDHRALRAAGGVQQVDLEREREVAASHPNPAAAAIGPEQVGEDLLQVGAVAEHLAGRVPLPAVAVGEAAVELAPGPLSTGGVDLAPVEPGPLVLVGEQVVGRRQLLEPRLGLRVAGVQVRVRGLRELAVGLADVLWRSGARHAQHLVRVAHRHPSSGQGRATSGPEIGSRWRTSKTGARKPFSLPAGPGVSPSGGEHHTRRSPMRLLALVAALLFAAGSAIACPMHTAGHGQTVAQKPPAQSGTEG